MSSRRAGAAGGEGEARDAGEQDGGDAGAVRGAHGGSPLNRGPGGYPPGDLSGVVRGGRAERMGGIADDFSTSLDVGPDPSPGGVAANPAPWTCSRSRSSASSVASSPASRRASCPCCPWCSSRAAWRGHADRDPPCKDGARRTPKGAAGLGGGDGAAVVPVGRRRRRRTPARRRDPRPPDPDAPDDRRRDRVAARRPYLVIAGLVTSFTLVTLVGTVLLNLLGLPQDLLRWAGIAVLALLGVGLLVPRFEEVLERPFQRLTPKRAPGAGRGGLRAGARPRRGVRAVRRAGARGDHGGGRDRHGRSRARSS